MPIADPVGLKPCLVSQIDPDMCTSEKKLPAQRTQMEVAKSLDSIAKEEARNLADFHAPLCPSHHDIESTRLLARLQNLVTRTDCIADQVDGRSDRSSEGQIRTKSVHV